SNARSRSHAARAPATRRSHAAAGADLAARLHSPLTTPVASRAYSSTLWRFERGDGAAAAAPSHREHTERHDLQYLANACERPAAALLNQSFVYVPLPTSFACP